MKKKEPLSRSDFSPWKRKKLKESFFPDQTGRVEKCLDRQEIFSNLEPLNLEP